MERTKIKTVQTIATLMLLGMKWRLRNMGFNFERAGPLYTFRCTEMSLRNARHVMRENTGAFTDFCVRFQLPLDEQYIAYASAYPHTYSIEDLREAQRLAMIALHKLSNGEIPLDE